MKPLNLSKEDRSTKEISCRLMKQVRQEIEGLDHGSIEIVVKGGFVIGFKFHQWKPFRSRREGIKEEK